MLVVKSLFSCQCRKHKRHGFNPWVRNIPWSWKWHPNSVFLPRKFHGQGSLVGYSAWGLKESDITELISLSIVNSTKKGSGFAYNQIDEKAHLNQSHRPSWLWLDWTWATTCTFKNHGPLYPLHDFTPDRSYFRKYFKARSRTLSILTPPSNIHTGHQRKSGPYSGISFLNLRLSVVKL